MDVRLVGTGNCKANGFSTSREQQPVIAHSCSARKQDLMRPKIKFDDLLTEAELNVILFIKALIPQWHIVKGDSSSEIVLRQVGTVIGERSVAAEHNQGILVAHSL